jgi:hypothetical protein
MRVAMRLLVALAIPGLVFGFLLQVPPLEFDRLELGFWHEDHSLHALVLALLVAVPGLLIAGALYIVIDWLSSASRPDRPAKP